MGYVAVFLEKGISLQRVATKGTTGQLAPLRGWMGMVLLSVSRLPFSTKTGTMDILLESPSKG
jgi:hypothetical protein